MDNNFSIWMHNASFLEWATNVTALAATLVLLLVTIGFRQYVGRTLKTPLEFIAAGIWTLSFTKLCRLLFWDVIPDLMNRTWLSFGITSSDINWIFNLGVAIGAVMILRGYFLLVDMHSPGHYNTLTAVFYPKKIRFWIHSRKGDDDVA